MNDKDTVVVPRATFDRIRRSMALLQQNSEGCAQNHSGGDFQLFGMPGWLIDTSADLEAMTALAAAPSTSVREEELEAALRECAKPYFWDADGFWPDASTPAHKQAEMERRQRFARAVLKPSTDKEVP